MNILFIEDGHKYFVDGVEKPSVTQIIRAEGFSDYSNIPQAQLEYAQQRGNAVHSACLFFDKNTLDFSKLSPPLLPYVLAWKKFKEMYQVKIIPEWAEKLSYCQKYDFAFRPDRILVINEKYILVDIKSGKPMEHHGIQLAGYKIGIKEESQKVDGRWTIELNNDETFNVIDWDKEPDHKNDEQIFLMILNLYKIKQRWGGKENGNNK
jgi:hypothetical protein